MKKTLIASGAKINDQSIVVVKGTSMLKKLTNLQEKHMAVIRQQWVDYIMSCKNSIEHDRAKNGIEWLYQYCGLDKPIIIFLDSPLACQYAMPYISAISNIFPSLATNSNTQVESQVGSQVESQVWSQVRSQVWSQVRSQVWSQVWSQVESQVWSQGLKYEPFSAYGSITDYGWVSFYDFFSQIGVVENKDFDQFKALLLSGIYDMIQLNGFCIVSGLPSKINRDDADRLHCLTGPAIEFKDGYSQYYIHGRAINAEIFNKAASGTLTRDEFVSETNDEIRSAYFEILGSERLMKLLEAELIDSSSIIHKNGEVETIEYYRTKENLNIYRGEPYAWRKVICPSTGTIYFTPTNPKLKSAIDVAKFHRPEWVPSSIDYAWYSRS